MSPAPVTKKGTLQTWEASDAATERAKASYTRLARMRQLSLRRYYNDPVAFVHDCIVWPENPLKPGEQLKPTEYQLDVLSHLGENHRVAQRGPHGLGKSTSHALALLWFAFTRDAAGVDWKCPTTAGGWQQLEQYLWPEIHKWANRLNWKRLGREPMKQGKELLRLNLQLTHGRAFAIASNVPARIEGAHADALMFIFDEAKIIPEGTWDAAEGAFSGTGESFAFASSTPGAPMGRFYDIHEQKPGLTSWWPRHVTIEEAVANGRVKPTWPEQQRLLWGEDSALYANRVLGNFYADDQTAIIPTSWVLDAVKRWNERAFASQLPKITSRYRPMPEVVDRVGVDVARSGMDKTVQALLAGNRIMQLLTASHDLTDVTTAKVEATLNQHPGAIAIVDADGLGVGVFDALKRMGKQTVPFHAGASTDKRDRTGELEFVNVKAAAWWQLREMLDPSNTPTLEIPDNAVLLGDLTAPKWGTTPKGKVYVEGKDDVKARLGRSPDFADAVMMGYWQDRPKRRRRAVHAGR